MSRLWIISYDIADDRRRRLLANLLGTHAERVQESLFEGWLAPAEVQRIEREIAGLIDPNCDTVRLYPISGPETGRRNTLGAMPASTPAPAFWVC
ncbi:CRISPR-associated endonuclease Cas2 [Azonexus sp.]|uniref:CRISPR-associated endonuclease Cas2 n=1 Tax=Azonexus sp. TaxID=1872668 RepID=UPI0035B1EF37